MSSSMNIHNVTSYTLSAEPHKLGTAHNSWTRDITIVTEDGHTLTITMFAHSEANLYLKCVS